ncbi:MAG: glycosyltransferase family 4 protein, partial [Acidimicrobiales bacterium]
MAASTAAVPPSATSLRVLVDASQLTGQSSFSGIGTYVRGLVDALQNVPTVSVQALATADAALASSCHLRTVSRLFRSGRPAVYEHEVRRAVEVRLASCDVFHNPNPHAPRFPGGRWVQTLHDVIPLVVDDPVGAALKRRFERFGPRYARADRVVAVSRHAADEGMRLLGLRAAQIEVIHHGVGAEFTPVPESPVADPPYVAMVSEYSRRKGLAEALEVLDRLAEAGYPHRLRIAGRVPPWVQAEFQALLRQCRHPERVDVLGFVHDLPAFYRDATVQMVTSRYEGFGFPAIEAMACGTPVVAFANTSLPEVVADGGALVTDGDVPAFTAAVRALLDTPANRLEARERAL